MLGDGENGEGIRKYKLVVTKESWGCKVQPREYNQYIVITVGCQVGTGNIGGDHFGKYMIV